MKKTLVVLAAVGGVALGSDAANGQERTISIQQVLERAAEYNPSYRQALNNLELAGAERREAIGAFLPNLNLSLSTSLNADRRLTAFDNFGNPIENPITEWKTRSSSSQSVNLSLELFDGLRRFHTIDQTNADARARVLAARASLAGVEATLRREFNASLRQAALLEIEEQARDGRARDLENTQELFRLADVSSVDVRAAELEVIRQDRTIGTARTAYRKALLNLRSEIGDASLEAFDLDGDPLEPFDPAALNLDRLVQTALEGSPTVLERDANIDRDRAGLKAARGGRWPTLSMSLSGQQGVSGDATTAFFDPYSNSSRFGSIGFSLSIPVFQRFQTSRQIAAADVTLRNAEQALREIELQTERDVRSQYLDLQDAWDTYQMNLRTRDLAEERLRMAREEYRLAGLDFTDLQTAIRDALAERRNVINAHFDFLDALVNLEETVGTGVAGTSGG